VSQRWFVKRVPFDFDWPVGQVWHGYVNPWPGPLSCPACSGTGLNEACVLLYQSFRKWACKLTRVEILAAKESGLDILEVEKIQKRVWAADTALIRSYLVEIRARRKGIWGICRVCSGTQVIPNQNPAVRQLYEGVNLYEEWQPIEPPYGEAWQLWEFAPPEGRPVSPVFWSDDLLAKWCAVNFRSDGNKWLQWISREGMKPEPLQPIFQLQSERIFPLTEPKRGEA
jgi:hypothetical protein